MNTLSMGVSEGGSANVQQITTPNKPIDRVGCAPFTLRHIFMGLTHHKDLSCCHLVVVCVIKSMAGVSIQ